MLDQIVLGNSVKVWGGAAAILIVSLVVGRLVSAFLAAVSRHMPTAVVHIIAEGTHYDAIHRGAQNVETGL